MPDATFIASTFGGGWIVPNDDDTALELAYFTGEKERPLMPLGGQRGWIVEPYDVEPLVLHLREAGYSIELEA